MSGIFLKNTDSGLHDMLNDTIATPTFPTHLMIVDSNKQQGGADNINRMVDSLNTDTYDGGVRKMENKMNELFNSSKAGGAKKHKQAKAKQASSESSESDSPMSESSASASDVPAAAKPAANDDSESIDIRTEMSKDGGAKKKTKKSSKKSKKSSKKAKRSSKKAKRSSKKSKRSSKSGGSKISGTRTIAKSGGNDSDSEPAKEVKEVKKEKKVKKEKPVSTGPKKVMPQARLNKYLSEACGRGGAVIFSLGGKVRRDALAKRPDLKDKQEELIDFAIKLFNENKAKYIAELPPKKT
ncbi:MAG: hypothetical protein Faunusvirus6_2 [Faunusvirus sp.]|jgi:hypothetical protein|uniref:Uncharacterized protein n=1 Tax=Faunusvirus sp. TaxID=2487766 RepID=A0A3G4ZY30_9VIRU|nr:MAG: hypothetical protein Faunusvirus6_2 [Faunusvirus sp.]